MHIKRRRQFLKTAAASALLATEKVQAVPNTQPAIVQTTPDQTIQRLGFERYSFSDGFYEHEVFAKGEGPIVILMHELPGFDAATVHFIDRLVAKGFRVHAPHLFGPLLWSDTAVNYVRLCISREFGYLAANRSAPVCNWLRALVRSLGQSQSNFRIGVVGLCLTGAFVIPMVIESAVHAGVISQPAIPLSLRYVASKGKCGKGQWMQEMNVSNIDLEAASQRCTRDRVPILLQRFDEDVLSTNERVERIAAAFGQHATIVQYPNSGLSSHPHALMTTEYDEATDFDPVNPNRENSTRIALQRVVEFLHANLDI
jgi:dienelactone hydrolase